MDWWWILALAVRVVSPAPDDRWAVRLAELDHARAVAFAQARPDLLDAVYPDRSPARSTDAATIAAYAARGGRVVGAELRVLSCHIIASSSTTVRLAVVDRLGAARVVWRDGSATVLPRDQPTSRTVTVRWTHDGWRIVGIVTSAP